MINHLKTLVCIFSPSLATKMKKNLIASSNQISLNRPKASSVKLEWRQGCKCRVLTDGGVAFVNMTISMKRVRLMTSKQVQCPSLSQWNLPSRKTILNNNINTLEPQDQNDNINFESLKWTGTFTSTAASKVKSTGIGELSVGVITPAFSRALWSKTSNLKIIVSNLHQNQTSQAKQIWVHKEPWEK